MNKEDLLVAALINEIPVFNINDYNSFAFWKLMLEMRYVSIHGRIIRSEYLCRVSVLILKSFEVEIDYNQTIVPHNAHDTITKYFTNEQCQELLKYDTQQLN